MKPKLLFIVYWIMFTCYTVNTNAQANTELSNLVSPTKVNQSLIPIIHNSKNLGSTSLSWGSIYLGGAVYLDGKRFLSNAHDLHNVFVGTEAGNPNRLTNPGGNNTATGYRTLYSNTGGSYNTANGSQALHHNTTGVHNTAIGYNALYFNINGHYNTANGFYALYSNTSGHFNTAIGYSAGSNNNNNNSCIFIGNDADQSVTTDFFNSTALGYSSRITSSNQVRIGNTAVTSIGGYEPWTNLSDGRFKKNVKENVPGLQFINQLHPVTYTMDVTKLRNFLGEDRQNEAITAEGKTVPEKNPEAEVLIQKGIQENEKIIRTGFSAQEVEEAAKKIGYDFSGVDKPANEHTPYGLRYSEFVVPLVKAVQELSKQNEAQQKEIDELKAIVFNQNNTSSLPKANPESDNALLMQNVPNPFANTTTIGYSLPQRFLAAQIKVTDKNGKQLKLLNISDRRSGTVNIDASTLSPGAYNYSLVIDGRVIISKQMIMGR